MANDLVVKLNGDSKGFQDSINSAKQSLAGLQQEGSKLDSFQQRFDKVVNSSKPMKKQLADLRGLLAEMNREGLNTSDVFTQIASHAGSLADNLGDAQQAVRAFADDNFNLQASAQAFELVAAGGSLVAGSMALMGVESEKATEIIAKVQGAIALLNGVQSISNLLNKDSALMLKLKQIQMKINEAQTKKNTVAQTANNVSEATGTATKVGATTATVANTVSTVANTTATAANTVAQNAWNTAKAIGKALLGDFSGLVLLAAAGITTYAIATSDSTKENEKNNDSIQTLKSTTQTYAEAVATETANLVGQFRALSYEWESARGSAEKLNAILPKVQSFFKGVGIEINNVNDANKVLVENADLVVDALQKIAQAKGALASVEEDWKKFYNDKYLQREIKIGGNGKLYRSSFSDERDRKVIDKYIRPLLTSEQRKEYDKTGLIPSVYHSQAQGYVNQARRDARYQQEEDLKKSSKRKTDDAMRLENEANRDLDKAGVNRTKNSTSSGSGKGHTTSSRNNSNNTQKPKTPYEKYKDLQSEARYVKELYDYNFIDETELRNREKDINERVQKISSGLKPITIDLEVKDDLENYNEFENQYRKVQTMFDKGLITEETAKDDVKKINDQLEQTLGKNAKKFELKVEVVPEEPKKSELTIKPEEEPDFFEYKSKWDKRQSYQNAQNIITQLQQDVELKILGADEAMTIIDEINKKLKELKMDPIDIKPVNGKLMTTADTIDLMRGNIENATNAMQSLGSAMQSIGKDGALAKAGLILGAIGQLVAGFAQAMLSESKNIWTWIAAAAAGTATLGAMIGQIKGFEKGGIVGGNSYYGDKMLIRANSSEMILTRSQQANLFNAINSGNFGSNMGGTVNFRIQGKELVGVIHNYNSKMSKVR